MVLTPFKVFLFLAGAAVAAGGAAYLAGAFDPRPAPPPIASAAPSATGEKAGNGAGDKSDRLPGDAEKPAGPAPAGEKPAAAATEVVVPPSFDVVRVEPNGGLVIAGHAKGGSNVEIVSGSEVLGKAQAGQQGDFAVVLEKPLKPGDYQLVLRSTAPDGLVATSTETAVVSIPDKPDGQVLALVEAPGKPSELITVPQPRQPAAAKPEAPQAPPAESEAARPEAPEAEASDPAAAQQEPAPARPGTPPPAAQEPPPAAQENETASAGTGPEAKEPVPVAPPPAVSAAKARVAVEAVEIEGRKVFVAGSADPGRLVRIYANDRLLGQSVTAPTGRFLVEAERDLAVGDYIIRADALAPNGSDVLARAAVPFQREPGEDISAVAPSAPPPAAEKQAAPVALPQPGSAIVQRAPEGQDGQTTMAAAPRQTGAPSAAAPAEGDTEPVTVTAPKLEKVDSTVIIRRGDTLWRISRRVYGHGIRYSTIYLANQSQIRDPDLIWPGQVFRLPEKSQEGEPADVEAMGDQLTTRPAAPDERTLR